MSVKVVICHCVIGVDVHLFRYATGKVDFDKCCFSFLIRAWLVFGHEKTSPRVEGWPLFFLRKCHWIHICLAVYDCKGIGISCSWLIYWKF